MAAAEGSAVELRGAVRPPRELAEEDTLVYALCQQFRSIAFYWKGSFGRQVRRGRKLIRKSYKHSFEAPGEASLIWRRHRPLLAKEAQGTARTTDYIDISDAPAASRPRATSHVHIHKVEKDRPCTNKLLCFYSLASVVLAAMFKLLHYTSMNKNENQFSDRASSEDTDARTIASGIILMATFCLRGAFSSAVCAYRTYRLNPNDGILELDYVALGGLSFMFQWYAIRSKAVRTSILIIFVIFLTHISSAFQPILTWATQSVNVNEKTSAVAHVYSGGHDYTYRGAPLRIDSNLGLEMVTTTGQYSSAGNSVFKDTGDGRTREVTTGVVRVGLSRGIQLEGSDHAGLVLRLDDTFAQVQTSCEKPKDKEQPSVLPDEDHPKNQGPGNWTSMSDNSGWRYNIKARDITKDEYQVHSTLNSTVHHMNDVNCSSVVTLHSGCFKFTLGTQNVTLLDKLERYNTTMVPPKVFPDFVERSSRSYEYLVERAGRKVSILTDSLKNFPKGFFESAEANFLHARVCASVALALKYVHKYVVGPDIAGNDDIDPSDYLKPQPLYRPSIRAYIRDGFAWGIAVTFVIFTVGLCSVAFCYARSAKMDVKGFEENALRYGVDSIITDKSKCDAACEKSGKREHAAHSMLMRPESP